MQIVLASKSPRRREILKNLGLNFEVVTADTDESSTVTDGAVLVEQLARRKAGAVATLLKTQNKLSEDTLIIGCDTVVCCDGNILGKPKDHGDAIRMLTQLQGREHRVISGLALITPRKVCVSHEETLVRFDAMSEEEIQNYVETNEPNDKAGAYAIQGIASKYIKGINGCYFNVVGLPVNLLRRLAKENNIPLF